MIQPNAWSCLPTAFAIATGISLETLLQRIGHDGSSLLFNDASFPHDRRAFHVQEIIDALYDFHIFVSEIECCPRLCGKEMTYSIFDNYVIQSRWNKYSKNHNLVLINNKHAVAWSYKDKRIIDPSGHDCPLEKFPFHAYFLIQPKEGIHGRISSQDEERPT
jgi:hypothetical protein